MNSSRIDESSARVRIDQLVANELCETRRAELIQWLEESRERWRDLGLAFLESQIWTSSLAELRSSAPASISIAATKSGQERHAMRRLRMGLVLAASLLFAFFGGVKWGEQVSNTNGDNSRMAHATDIVSDRSKAAVQNEKNPVARETSADRAPFKAIEISAYGKSASGTLEKIKMPVHAVLSASRSSEASERVKRSLKDRGFSVRTEQRFLPATLSDGTEVMLAVDQVMANYVGKTVY